MAGDESAHPAAAGLERCRIALSILLQVLNVAAFRCSSTGRGSKPGCLSKNNREMKRWPGCFRVVSGGCPADPTRGSPGCRVPVLAAAIPFSPVNAILTVYSPLPNAEGGYHRQADRLVHHLMKICVPGFPTTASRSWWIGRKWVSKRGKHGTDCDTIKTEGDGESPEGEFLAGTGSESYP